MLLSLRRSSNLQPQGLVGLSGKNPSAAGIVMAVVSHGGLTRELLTGALPASGNGTRANSVFSFGRARQYTSGADFFTTPPSLDAPAAYSWLVRAKFTAFGSSFDGVFSKNSNTATTTGFGSYYSVDFYVNHSNVSGILVPGVGSQGTLTALGVTNILVTWDGATVRYWRDGVLVGSVAYATAPTSGAGYLKVLSNRDVSTTSAFHDHTIVWDRALSSAEAAFHSAGDNAYSLFEARRIWVPVSAGGGSLDLTETTGVSLAGTVATSGDIQIGTNFNLTQSSAVGLTGSLATTGDIQIGTTFNLAQTANVGLVGSLGVSGDLQILSGSLDLTQTSAVAMSGTVGLSGDIQIGTIFNLAQTAAVGLTGSVGTTGNIQIGTNFNLAQSVALAMSGSVAVAGDIQSGTGPVVTQSFGNFGWDPRKRLSWKRKELREELEVALDDAPKAVQELVRVPGPDISQVPVREALEVVREARKHRERAVTRQEIDELHEALETVAAFTREREAVRQARRRKQQHLLLLS